MDSHQMYQLIAFALFFLLSLFFSMSESAFRNVNQIRLQHDADEGNQRADLVMTLLKQSDTLFATLLLGNNLTKIASAVIATLISLEFFPTYGALIAALATTFFLVLFGDIPAKLIGKVYSKEVSTRFASILNLLKKLLKPFIWMLQRWQLFIRQILPLPSGDKISEEELLYLVDEAHSVGSIELEEHQLVKAAIEFDDKEVSSILTPRVDVVGFDITSSLDEIEQLYLNSPYSRLVVYNDSLDEIVGTMHGKDFYRYLDSLQSENRTDSSIEDWITKPLFVPATISFSDLLQSMQHNHTHIGFIMDEYGQMIGIATMEDVLEELVGEIWDESDVIRTEIRQLSGENRYLIEGTYSLDKLFDLFGMKRESDWLSSTVSGFIMEQFEHIPQNNEVIYYKDLKIIVVNAQKQRVNEVIVQKIS